MLRRLSHPVLHQAHDSNGKKAEVHAATVLDLEICQKTQVHGNKPQRFAHGSACLCKALSDTNSTAPAREGTDKRVDASDVENRRNSDDSLVKFSNKMRPQSTSLLESMSSMAQVLL